MNRDNPSELFPVVDETGRVVGCATRGECHDGRRLLHPVVHLHLFNSRGELYLQKRPLWKDIQPGRWDTAVGGHIDYGETPDEALRREVREELGVTEFTPERVNWSTSTAPSTTAPSHRATRPTADGSGRSERSSAHWARVSSRPISRANSAASS